MSKFSPLKRKLESAGWSIFTAELPSDVWWASEIWKLESIWSPSGKIVYLSLMLDPQGSFDQNNPKDTDVWGIGLSNSFPTGRLHVYTYNFDVKRNFAIRIDEISETANKMRTS